ncbi:18990_t:CDS:2, partial [Gigaspora rosea]
LPLRMTVSNGWSFWWTSDPATLEFFEFLNPKLILPADTRWNSYSYCFKSLIKSHQALQNLATTHELPLDTSACDSDGKLDQSSTRLNELYLPCNIMLILLNDNFWQSIKELHSLLHPYCKALNKLQSDTARLHEVLQAFEDNLDIISDNWEEQLYDWEQMLADEETAMLEEEKVERENNEYSLSSDSLNNNLL